MMGDMDTNRTKVRGVRLTCKQIAQLKNQEYSTSVIIRALLDLYFSNELPLERYVEVEQARTNMYLTATMFKEKTNV